MTKEDKRKHSRFKSMNLLSFAYLDEKGNIVMEGMGRTLNMSEGGILLETHDPMEVGNHLVVTIALKNDLIEVKGTVKHAMAVENGQYRAGIQFIELDEEKNRILRELMAAFNGEG
jgi:hypothetical protein